MNYTNTGCQISSVIIFRALDNSYLYTYEVCCRFSCSIFGALLNDTNYISVILMVSKEIMLEAIRSKIVTFHNLDLVLEPEVVHAGRSSFKPILGRANNTLPMRMLQKYPRVGSASKISIS